MGEVKSIILVKC